MYTFGDRSQKQLITLHHDLQLILNEAIQYYDFSIISGLRTAEEQHALYLEGKSKLNGYENRSKHQGTLLDDKLVSFAVDIIPYKKGSNAFSGKMEDIWRFYYMMGIIKGCTHRLLAEGLITHEVRFGLDWDSDDVYNDQNFNDLPHIELI